MHIPINPKKNPHSPKNEKLKGLLLLPETLEPLPPIAAAPWMVHCNNYTGAQKAFCALVGAVGMHLQQITRLIKELQALRPPGNPTWETFLAETGPQQRFKEFADHLDRLYKRFNFQLGEHGEGFTFPLNDSYKFTDFSEPGLPKISGTVRFESDEVTGIPLTFTVNATAYVGGTSSSSYSSSYNPNSSSSDGGGSAASGGFVTDPNGATTN